MPQEIAAGFEFSGMLNQTLFLHAVMQWPQGFQKFEMDRSVRSCQAALSGRPISSYRCK